MSRAGPSILAAGIITAALLAVAFLLSDRYYLLRLDADKMVRLDRWTGGVKVYACFGDGDWITTCGEVFNSNPGPPNPNDKTVKVDETLTTTDIDRTKPSSPEVSNVDVQ